MTAPMLKLALTPIVERRRRLRLLWRLAICWGVAAVAASARTVMNERMKESPVGIRIDRRRSDTFGVRTDGSCGSVQATIPGHPNTRRP